MHAPEAARRLSERLKKTVEERRRFQREDVLMLRRRRGMVPLAIADVVGIVLRKVLKILEEAGEAIPYYVTTNNPPKRKPLLSQLRWSGSLARTQPTSARARLSRALKSSRDYRAAVPLRSSGSGFLQVDRVYASPCSSGEGGRSDFRRSYSADRRAREKQRRDSKCSAGRSRRGALSGA